VNSVQGLEKMTTNLLSQLLSLKSRAPVQLSTDLAPQLVAACSLAQPRSQPARELK
jgi:hypothetical protein